MAGPTSEPERERERERAGWLARSLAGWLAGSLAGWLAGSLAGWRVGLLGSGSVSPSPSLRTQRGEGIDRGRGRQTDRQTDQETREGRRNRERERERVDWIACYLGSGSVFSSRSLSLSHAFSWCPSHPPLPPSPFPLPDNRRIPGRGGK